MYKKKSLYILFCFFLAMSGYCQSSGVVINEICAKNDHILTDQDGEYDDWIELYNSSSSTINLEGYYLSDNKVERQKWSFPAGSEIAANDFLIVWADKDPLQTGLHANFKISADGEEIYFSDPSGMLIDSVIFSFQYADITFGRYPDAWGDFVLMNPTFSSENSNEDLIFHPVSDNSDSLYNPDYVVKIEITMDPEDWDFIRLQEREDDDQGDCPAEPFTSPFIYKSANVKINKHVFENVGIRKKGFRGSIHGEKPSLKIKLDKFVDGLKVYDTELLTLNNLKADKSCAKESIIYQIYSEAGVKASRCNFAHVTVNGDTLGLFTNIESINKDFLERNFYNGEGKLYEGIITDLIMDQLYALEAKSSESEDRTELHTLISVLNLSDDRFLPVISEFLDIDQFIHYWAVEILINQLDGYNYNGNNYLFYFHPVTGKVIFIPWGVDLAMRRGYEPIINFTRSKLPNRLYEFPEIRQKLIVEINHLLNTVWDEDRWLNRVSEIEELLTPFLPGDIIRTKIDPKEINPFIAGRREQLEAFLNDVPKYTHEMKPCDFYTGGEDCYFGETLEQWGVTYICNNGEWEISSDSTHQDQPGKAFLYPNPAYSRITINAALNSSYSIFSLLGVKVLEGEINQEYQNIDISSLQEKVYLLKVGEEVLKFIKLD